AARGRAWRDARARAADPGRSAGQTARTPARARALARRAAVARARARSAMSGTACQRRIDPGLRPAQPGLRSGLRAHRPHTRQSEAEDRQAPGKCDRGDERDDLPWPRAVDAEIPQEIALALDVETDDAALPLVIHRIPVQAQALDPGHVQARKIRHRLALRQ